jgi:hypothetical protein
LHDPDMRYALLAMCVLTGCSLVDPNYIAAEGHAVSAAAPGTGTIRSIAILPRARAAESASAGASADPHAYRLYVDMDNGRTQTVDVDNAKFMTGQRVQIGPDGRVVAF